LSQIEATTINWEMHGKALRSALETGGAFLLTPAPHGRTNPMTIGWAQLGIVWSRPICTVFVRISRYTHRCITEASEFAISAPAGERLRDELAVCGSVSGRDSDKVSDTGLALVPGREIAVPVIEGCELQIECRIVARTQMLPQDLLAEDILKRYYPKGDEHLAVFGEIVAIYKDDGKEEAVGDG